MLVSLYNVISCDIINVKNFREILRCFFQILATMNANKKISFQMQWKKWKSSQFMENLITP